MKISFLEILKNCLLEVKVYLIVVLIITILFASSLFVYNGFEDMFNGKSFNKLYVGIILLIPFLIWYLILGINNYRKGKKRKFKRLKLINSGDKIIIRLNTILIKSNNWKKEVIIDEDSQYEKVVNVDKSYNYLTLKVPYKDSLIHYSSNIEMDTTKLKMLFAIKKETYLYVDPENANNFYLDLSFLE